MQYFPDPLQPLVYVGNGTYHAKLRILGHGHEKAEEYSTILDRTVCNRGPLLTLAEAKARSVATLNAVHEGAALLRRRNLCSVRLKFRDLGPVTLRTVTPDLVTKVQPVEIHTYFQKERTVGQKRQAVEAFNKVRLWANTHECYQSSLYNPSKKYVEWCLWWRGVQALPSLNISLEFCGDIFSEEGLRENWENRARMTMWVDTWFKPKKGPPKIIDMRKSPNCFGTFAELTGSAPVPMLA